MDQLELKSEAAKRDRALNLLEETRGSLIDVAREVAVTLAREQGRVTSTHVIQRLRELGMGEQIDAVDRRFMGAVFRNGQGWERVGFENLGSHRRPVSVWKLRSA